ncbi:BTB/POZ domain-containing protein POB1 [Acorus calamus]|uniref:BTB/POZ domain-containing protein POB1 n=1 Tax=Acorus calamus TaxID=4465 RepID=A0AAV9EGI6_ACOCL|nr:BTB/POZ domain-containing protein POB1 [Acorus calamus]
MRAYKSKPVKVIDIQLPKPYCIVYFALENEECASLFPEGSIYSELFYLGGNAFYFRVDCKNFMEAFPHYCNIYLCLELEDAFDPIGVECDYAMRGRAEGRFVKERRVIIPFCSSSGGRIGSHGLYGFEWSSFIEENSTYFVDGMLQLKVELTLNTLQL